VAAVFADGLVSYRAVEVIVWRTAPIANPVALAAVDAAVADALVARAPLSDDGLAMAVDAFVDALDPDAIERTERGAESRGVTVHHDDAAGTAYLSCTLFSHEAWALEQLVDAMAQAACPSHLGSVGERRADALGTLARGPGRWRCTAAKGRDP
jgi:hypothetical protein